ncbi:MAG: class I SAM-dependent methyltransferase, partial [Terriglobales bacterium]
FWDPRMQMTTETARSANPISLAELRGLLLAYREENWHGIQTPEVQKQIVEAMLQPDAQSVLTQVSQFWQIPGRACVLDIGSGVGGFVVGCRQLGHRALGVEPDRIGAGGRVTSIQIASRRVAENVFANAVGEALPFAGQTFDLVTLNQVVEHVPDPMAVLREAVRVLRRGGAMYVACPNYLRFYEPHYKVFWLPLFPKFLARFYLRLRDRNPVMLKDLYYTTNGRLKNWLQALGEDYTVIDFHREQFMRKCAGQGRFESSSARFVQKLTSLPVLGPVIKSAALGWFRLREGGCEMLVLRKGAVD